MFGNQKLRCDIYEHEAARPMQGVVIKQLFFHIIRAAIG